MAVYRITRMYSSWHKLKVAGILSVCVLFLNAVMATMILTRQTVIVENTCGLEVKDIDFSGSEAKHSEIQETYNDKQPTAVYPVRANKSQNAPDARSDHGDEDFFRSRKLIPINDLGDGCDNETRVVVLVASIPHHASIRNAARNTWAKLSEKHKKQMRIIFVTGDHEGRKEISFELETHGDMLVGSFIYTVPVKTTNPLLLGVRWALEKCKSLEYLFFGLDAVVLNKDMLLDRLKYHEKEGMFTTPSLMGKTVTGSKVVRYERSIYFVSEEAYKDDVFPPFCTDESGYIFTKSVALQLLECAQQRPFIPIGDVFLGISAVDYNWHVVEDGLFTRRKLNVGNICTFDTLVTMRASENELVSTWQNMKDKSFRRDCADPDLDMVLPGNVDNRAYFREALSYKLNHPHVCYDDEGNDIDIFMLVLISTPPDHVDVRNAIRNTWCKEKNVLGQKIRCLFVIGESTSSPDEVNKKLRKEDAKYRDIIQVSFQESFQNLTLKVVLGLKWITENCQHTKYFYKGDEDMFVNFENIISYLMKLRSRGEGMSKFWLGHGMYGSLHFSPNNPKHSKMTKYQVSDDKYYGRYYPPYNGGGGYVFSTDTVPDMYRLSFTTSLINIDDAYQGFLTKQLGFGPTMHKGFIMDSKTTDSCTLRNKNTMVVHGNTKTAAALYGLWIKFIDSSVNCDK